MGKTGWLDTRGRAVRISLGLLVACLCIQPAMAIGRLPHVPLQQRHVEHEPVSADVRYVAEWVVRTADNGGRPYLIIDKVEAKVFAFDAKGRLNGMAPALIGVALGDHTVPGIGERALSNIRPEERTTPAGRFVASMGRNLREDVLWLDYESGVSLHRVVKGTLGERRAERLASKQARDRRISYGCVNVPAKFYEDFVSPAFTLAGGIVYVLPETRPAREVFTSQGTGAGDGAQGAAAAPLVIVPDDSM